MRPTPDVPGVADARTEPGAEPRAVRSGTPAHLSDFTALTARVKELGLMRRDYLHYWTKLIGLPAAGLALIVAFVLIGDSWWQLAVATAMALFMTQIAFLGHDAAHRQIFVSARWNEWVSLVVINLFAGMGMGWWQSKHSKHHNAPNKVAADPDIAPGVLVWTHEDARARRTRPGRWLATKQGWFFYPLLLLEGVNLHAQGLARLLRRGPVKRRWVELSLITVRMTVFLGIVFLVLPPGKGLAFLAVELGIFGLYMGLAFAPNHIGMPVVPAGVKVDFLRRQVAMSRNVSGGRWVDTALGGLNFQIEHHLFPSMSRPNLRRVAPLVREHCRNLGVAYHETSLWASYTEVTRHLNKVGRGGIDVWACPLAAQLGRG